ncbi:MAG: hypothetical protein HGB18_01665 [Candidatus Moranbacteria bacterium]|nr:hypothetical protein [Candidatus Moranbacteria bacterium]
MTIEGIIEREEAMHRKLAAENGSRCAWGECGKYGVVPLFEKVAHRRGGTGCGGGRSSSLVGARYNG